MSAIGSNDRKEATVEAAGSLSPRCSPKSLVLVFVVMR